jgi:hypothetical protein
MRNEIAKVVANNYNYDKLALLVEIYSPNGKVFLGNKDILLFIFLPLFILVYREKKVEKILFEWHLDGKNFQRHSKLRRRHSDGVVRVQALLHGGEQLPDFRTGKPQKIDLFAGQPQHRIADLESILYGSVSADKFSGKVLQ